MAFSKKKKEEAADARLEKIADNLKKKSNIDDDKKTFVHLAMTEKQKRIFKEYFSAHGTSLNSGFIACAEYVKLLEETGKINFSKSLIMTV